MTDSNADRNIVEVLAEEFVARRRAGECPSVHEYAHRHPEVAEEIEDLFPALLMMEKLKPDDEPSIDEDAPEPTTQKLERVGDYRILGELGRGGMGVVYEAEQQSLGRRVALKVLSQNITGNKKAITRFQREARAAARMHHTNIVPVFEVGQNDDHLFYAMQLIQGQSLDLVVEDLRELRQQSIARSAESMANSRRSVLTPKSIANSLVSGQFGDAAVSASDDADSSVPAALEVASVETDDDVNNAMTQTIMQSHGSTVSAALPGKSDMSTVENDRQAYYRSVARIGHQTADALAYSHARGIVHRDIKPSNLLLDGGGIVWITDFGLAKTGDSDMTQTGDILGTIRYMSPERFKGQCDVRADVYSLGLTLYELLSLKPAFAAVDQLNLVEKIASTEPESPRSIDPKIPLDLETIVLKAIDKEPKRRYQSADEMAEDLQRFINDEPVKARRASTLERFTRWGRRNRNIAASLLAIATLLVMMAVGSTVAAAYYRNQEQTQRALAEQNEQLAREMEIEKRRAEQQRERADRGFERARQTVDKYLTEVSQEELKHIAGVKLLREELLAGALEFYKDFVAERADDPTLKRSMADAHLKIGLISSELRSSRLQQGGNDALQNARKLYRELLREAPNDKGLLVGLAKAERQHLKPALWQQLALSHPNDEEIQMERLRANMNHAAHLAGMGEYSDALGHEYNALKTHAEIFKRDPHNIEYRRQFASILRNIALDARRNGRLNSAQQLFLRVLRLAESNREAAPNDDSTAMQIISCCQSLAAIALEKGNAQDRIQYLKKAAYVAKQVAELNPRVRSHHHLLFSNYDRLARVQKQLSLEDDALDTTEELAALLTERLNDVGAFQSKQLAELIRHTLKSHDGSDETQETTVRQRRLAEIAVAALQRFAQKHVTAEDSNENPSLGMSTEMWIDYLAEQHSLKRFDVFDEFIARMHEDPQLAVADVARTETAENEQLSATIDADFAAGLATVASAQRDYGRLDRAELAQQAANEIRQNLQKRVPGNLAMQVQSLISKIESGVLAWDADQLTKAERLWLEARRTLEQATKQVQADRQLSQQVSAAYRQITDCYTAKALWENAISTCQQTLRYDSGNHAEWRRLLSLLAYSEQREEYDRYRRAMLERFGRAATSITAERTAKACLLMPVESEHQMQLIARVAEKANPDDQTDQHLRNWMWMMHTMHAIRNQDFASASSALESLSGDYLGWRRGTLVAALKAINDVGMGRNRHDLLTDFWRETTEEEKMKVEEVLTTSANLPDYLVARCWMREALQALDLPASTFYVQERCLRAMSFYQLGQIDKAEQEFALVANIAPKDPRTHFARGASYFELGLTTQADSCFQQAKELLESRLTDSPHDLSDLSLLADVQRHLELGSAAGATLQKAIGVFDSVPTKILMLASYRRLHTDLRDVHLESGNEEEARNVMETFYRTLEDHGRNELLSKKKHHHLWIESVALLPDANLAVSASYDHKMLLWDLGLGKDVGVFEGHTGPVRRVIALRNRDEIVSCSNDGSIRIWDTTTQKQIGDPLIGHTSAVQDIAISQDETRLLSAGNDGKVVLWDLESRSIVKEVIGNTTYDAKIQFAAHDRQAIWIGDSQSLYAWDLSQDNATELKQFEFKIWSLGVSPNGQRVTLGLQGALVVWDLAAGRPLRRFRQVKMTNIRSVQYIDDDLVLCGFQPRRGTNYRDVAVSGHGLRLVDLKNGRTIASRKSQRVNGVGVIDFAILNDSGRVFAACGDGQMKLWSFSILAQDDDVTVARLAARLDTLNSADEDDENPFKRRGGEIAKEAAIRPAVLSQLMERFPDDRVFALTRAQQLSREGNLDAAARELMTAVEVHGELPPRDWNWLAPGAALAGYADEVRRLCRDLRDRILSDIDEAEATESVAEPPRPPVRIGPGHALTLLMLPETIDEWGHLQEQLWQPYHTMYRSRMSKPAYDREFNSLAGMIAYREGRLEEAIELLRFEDSSRMALGRSGMLRLPSLFMLSMAYHRTGDSEAAKRVYDFAFGRFEQRRSSADDGNGATRMQLHVWELLANEAKAVLEGDATQT